MRVFQATLSQNPKKLTTQFTRRGTWQRTISDPLAISSMMQLVSTVVATSGEPGGRSLPSWICHDWAKHRTLIKESSDGREHHGALGRHHPRSNLAKQERIQAFRESRIQHRVSYRQWTTYSQEKGKLILAPNPSAPKRIQVTPHQIISYDKSVSKHHPYPLSRAAWFHLRFPPPEQKNIQSIHACSRRNGNKKVPLHNSIMECTRA